MYGDPLIQPLLKPIFRNAAVSLGISDVDALGCADLQSLCSLPDARLLRMVCGATCGRNDPYASAWPWHMVTSQGCIPQCLQEAT